MEIIRVGHSNSLIKVKLTWVQAVYFFFLVFLEIFDQDLT